MVMYDLDNPERLTKEIIPFDSWNYMYTTNYTCSDTNSFYAVINPKGSKILDQKILQIKLTPQFETESMTEINFESMKL